jgi:hypothetical protein
LPRRSDLHTISALREAVRMSISASAIHLLPQLSSLPPS